MTRTLDPGDDAAYEMMRGHKQEVRLLTDAAGNKAGATALIMSQPSAGYALLRFKHDMAQKLVAQSDYEPT